MADSQTPCITTSPRTAQQLWDERSILVGIFLGAVAFGVHLTLFISCVHALGRAKWTMTNKLFLLYISLLFILGNIGNGTNLKFTTMTFVDNRDYPGGPGAYFVEQSTIAVSVLCNAAYIVNSWLQDGLLVFRFYIFGNRNLYLMALPVIMFVSSTALSLLLIVELSRPEITMWTKISINLAIPYWAISIALNVLITLFISGRLLHMRHKMRQFSFGSGEDYLSITAMMVESASLYTINGLVFLISYACGSAIQNLALPVLGQMQSIAPLLIILRVAQGRSWSNSVSRTTQEDKSSAAIELRMNFRQGFTTQNSEASTQHGISSDKGAQISKLED